MQIADNPVAFNLINDDWPGNLYEDEHELVTYKNNASMRIWYNHQTHGYRRDAHPDCAGKRNQICFSL